MIAIKLLLLPRDTINSFASTTLIPSVLLSNPSLSASLLLLQSLRIGLFINLMSITPFFMEIYKNHFSWFNLLVLLILITQIMFAIFIKPFMALSKPTTWFNCLNKKLWDLNFFFLQSWYFTFHTFHHFSTIFILAYVDDICVVNSSPTFISFLMQHHFFHKIPWLYSLFLWHWSYINTNLTTPHPNQAHTRDLFHYSHLSLCLHLSPQHYHYHGILSLIMLNTIVSLVLLSTFVLLSMTYNLP